MGSVTISLSQVGFSPGPRGGAPWGRLDGLLSGLETDQPKSLRNVAGEMP